jgi:hypothetical protein
MRSDTAPSTPVPDPRLAAGGKLRVSDLNRAERLVICAIRAGASRPGSSDSFPVAEHEREEIRDLRRVIERYLHHHMPAAPGREDAEADPWLGVFEFHTLHALACLQAGLLGEAWKSLVPVWGAGEAGPALVRLQDVAEALQSRDHRVERWQFDPAFFREAALI